jgi:hypothetical protein
MNIEFTKEFFEGKKFGDIITDNTKILTDFSKGFDIRKEVFEKSNRVLGIETYEDLTVVYTENFVICFKFKEPIALFHVYELHDCHLNGRRNLITASGHETNHEYWIDKGEYEVRYTR